MFINKKRDYIFFHIPKTAGISIRNALWGPRIAPHISALAIKETNPGDFRRCFTFAFVRNPWSRFVSAYEYLKKGGNPKWDASATARVNKYKSAKELLLSNDKVLDWVHLKPQWHWICNHDGKILVDFIGRTEQIKEGLEFIADKTGVQPRELKKLNVNPHRHYSEYFDEEALSVFNEKYSVDINMFQYKFKSDDSENNTSKLEN